MMIVPVSWSFRRTGFLPIIEAKGECSVDGAKYMESILISNALEMIDEAKKFKGIPYQTEPSPSNPSLLTVSFSLVFPSDKELGAFIESMKK